MTAEQKKAAKKRSRQRRNTLDEISRLNELKCVALRRDVFDVDVIDSRISCLRDRLRMIELEGVWARVFRAEWRTGTVLSLSRAMREAGDFSAMPILADAIQEAGCDNEDALRCMRDATFPWAGCRVLEDLR